MLVSTEVFLGRVFLVLSIADYNVSIIYDRFPLQAPIVATPQDQAIAYNSPNDPSIIFMNTNTGADGATVTLNVGDKVSIKCGALGNPSQHTSWDWTWGWDNQMTGYTELTGCTGCTLMTTQMVDSTTG